MFLILLKKINSNHLIYFIHWNIYELLAVINLNKWIFFNEDVVRLSTYIDFMFIEWQLISCLLTDVEVCSWYTGEVHIFTHTNVRAFLYVSICACIRSRLINEAHGRSVKHCFNSSHLRAWFTASTVNRILK